MSVFGMLSQAGILCDGSSVRIPGLQSNIGRGKTIYLDAANGSATGNALSPTTAITTLTGAVAKITTGRNDVVRLIASSTSVSLAENLDWSYNCSHLIGEGSFGVQNMRSRIGHSANFATLMTISGYGNSFHNLYFMHGRGSATNATGINITGPRNSFINCHFGGPAHATEAGTAAYRLVKLANSETYFKNCVFGLDTIPLTAAVSLVEFGAQADPPRAVFDDCLFIVAVNAAGGQGATFMSVVAGCGEGLALFRNCQFVNIGSSALTLGIDGAGLNNFKMAFNNNCYFAGVTDVAAAAHESRIFFAPANTVAAQVTGGASVAVYNGLAAPYDHTA